jgi:nitrogen-specific signal transduction histidine kinase/CheY-like chemotaxis protein
MMESMLDGAYICSPDFQIKYMNPAMIRRVGRDASGELCSKVLYDLDDKCPWCVYDQVSQGEHIQYEVLNPKNKRYYQVSSSPVFHTDGSISKLTISRDITENKKMEAEVLKSKKLESVGTLSGGIAHDFNNLLSVIVGNIELAKDKIKHDFGVFENLKEVEKASIRARDLAAQLITFSQGGRPVKKVVSIGELVKNAVGAALSGSDINCELSIADDLFPVEIDALQIKQVIRNIAINATEAMNGKGTINVYCENTAVGEKDRLPLKAGKYVLLSVKDQGIGIAAENLPKIFDPYFSTKEMGPDKGQGLGLATCYSIIDKHDGFIMAESEVAVGTTLYIYLPASEKEIEELEPVQKPVSEKPVVGRGKILVMDDEGMIRNLVEQMLSLFGYDIALAQDGTEAVALYRSAMESGKPFDAVLLDLTVKSGMGGKTAVQKLLEIDPHVKAIVSSGYYNDSVMTDFKKYGFTAALVKPYSMKVLRDTLSKVLIGKSADH